jgi:hypothetical protein
MQKATLKMIKTWTRPSAKGAAVEAAHPSGGRYPDLGSLTDGDADLSGPALLHIGRANS